MKGYIKYKDFLIDTVAIGDGNKMDKIKELEYAKEAVRFCLADSTALVDMKGLVYWSNRVDQLRKEIKL